MPSTPLSAYTGHRPIQPTGRSHLHFGDSTHRRRAPCLLKQCLLARHVPSKSPLTFPFPCNPGLETSKNPWNFHRRPSRQTCLRHDIGDAPAKNYEDWFRADALRPITLLGKLTFKGISPFYTWKYESSFRGPHFPATRYVVSFTGEKKLMGGSY